MTPAPPPCGPAAACHRARDPPDRQDPPHGHHRCSTAPCARASRSAQTSRRRRCRRTPPAQVVAAVAAHRDLWAGHVRFDRSTRTRPWWHDELGGRSARGCRPRPPRPSSSSGRPGALHVLQGEPRGDHLGDGHRRPRPRTASRRRTLVVGGSTRFARHGARSRRAQPRADPALEKSVRAGLTCPAARGPDRGSGPVGACRRAPAHRRATAAWLS